MHAAKHCGSYRPISRQVVRVATGSVQERGRGGATTRRTPSNFAGLREPDGLASLAGRAYQLQWAGRGRVHAEMGTGRALGASRAPELVALRRRHGSVRHFLARRNAPRFPRSSPGAHHVHFRSLRHLSGVDVQTGSARGCDQVLALISIGHVRCLLVPDCYFLTLALASACRLEPYLRCGA
jgi:hypothetical protein